MGGCGHYQFSITSWKQFSTLTDPQDSPPARESYGVDYSTRASRITQLMRYILESNQYFDRVYKIKKLLKRRHNSELSKNSIGETALHVAARNYGVFSNPDILIMLIKQYPDELNTVGVCGLPPLELLLNLRAVLISMQDAKNTMNECSNVVAHWRKFKNLDFATPISLMISAGARLSTNTIENNRAFLVKQILYRYQQFEITKLLLSQYPRAPTVERFYDGESLLHMVIKFYSSHRVQIVQLLLELGASVTVRSRYDRSALAELLLMGHHTETDTLAEMLLKAGADPFEMASNESLIRIIVRKHESVDLLVMMIKACMHRAHNLKDGNEPDTILEYITYRKAGYSTILECALDHGKLEMFNYLLSFDEDKTIRFDARVFKTAVAHNNDIAINAILDRLDLRHQNYDIVDVVIQSNTDCDIMAIVEKLLLIGAMATQTMKFNWLCHTIDRHVISLPLISFLIDTSEPFANVQLREILHRISRRIGDAGSLEALGIVYSAMLTGRDVPPINRPAERAIEIESDDESDEDETDEDEFYEDESDEDESDDDESDDDESDDDESEEESDDSDGYTSSD